MNYYEYASTREQLIYDLKVAIELLEEINDNDSNITSELTDVALKFDDVKWAIEKAQIKFNEIDIN